MAVLTFTILSPNPLFLAQGTVVYNKGFSQSLRYSRGHLFIYDKLVRAMCRICRNISNPANGLVQPNGAKCFPASFASYLANYQECAFLSQTSSSTALTVDPLIYVEAANSNSFSVKSVVMAFRSVSLYTVYVHTYVHDDGLH